LEAKPVDRLRNISLGRNTNTYEKDLREAVIAARNRQYNTERPFVKIRVFFRNGASKGKESRDGAGNPFDVSAQQGQVRR